MDILLFNSLHKEGTLAKLYKAGFLSQTTFLYGDIYLWVNAQMKVRGISKEAAVLEAELKFEVGRTTVYKALTRFTNYPDTGEMSLK